MRLLSAEALILDVVDLHEQDRIVTFLTSQWGRKRGVAQAARRKFSRFAGQLQLLSRVSIRWFEKDHRDLVRIENAELVEPPPRILGDLEGILLGSYFADSLVQFTQENEDSDDFFRLLSSTLEALQNDVDRSLAARYFEVWVLRLAGIFPVPRQCPICDSSLSRGARLPANGDAVVCVECAPDGSSSLVLSPQTLDFLVGSGRSSLAELAPSPPELSALRQVEEVCKRVRRNFLTYELRSYGVMKATLVDRSESAAAPPG